MREAIAFALLACACGVTARQTTSTSTSTSTPTPTRNHATAFPDLEARWAPLLPGMHIITTRDATVETVEVARADSQDICVRVAFDASGPVVATLADSGHATVGPSPEQKAGLLPADGPICIRRGEALQATATGPAGTRVRWLAWSSR